MIVSRTEENPRNAVFFPARLFDFFTGKHPQIRRNEYQPLSAGFQYKAPGKYGIVNRFIRLGGETYPGHSRAQFACRAVADTGEGKKDQGNDDGSQNPDGLSIFPRIGPTDETTSIRGKQVHSDSIE